MYKMNFVVCVQVAKSAFQRNKDPMDAAIFYLAMKKKNVLWGLYRFVSNVLSMWEM